MTYSLGALVGEAIRTIRDPRAGARWAMAQPLSPAERWMLLVAVALLGVLITAALEYVAPTPEPILLSVLIRTMPMGLAVMQVFTFVLMLVAIVHIGRMFGGAGAMPDAVILLAWLQMVLILVEVVQIAAVVLMPPLAVLLGIVSALLFFWLMTNFIAELHGFRRLAVVFFVSLVIATVLGAILIGLGRMAGIEL